MVSNPLSLPAVRLPGVRCVALALITVLLLGPVLATAAAGALPEGLTTTDWQTIRQQIATHAYSATATAGGDYQARNPAQGLQIVYSADGTTRLTPEQADGWHWGLTLSRVGAVPLHRPTLSRAGPTVTYHWSRTIREWWVNSATGLEQWFALSERPAGLLPEQALLVQMTISGNLRAVPVGAAVAFTDAAGTTVFTYDKLKVWDATGQNLPARMQVAGQTLTLVVDDTAAVYPLTIDPVIIVQQQAYLKASNTGLLDMFGFAVAVDGDTAVVGAFVEESAATGINGNQNDNSANFAGAAYVFVRNGGTWSQQAYLKASNTNASDRFGFAVAVDGDTVVVGAPFESSSATGVNGNGSDNTATQAGAAYVFVRTNTTWSQQAYLKASNTDALDAFGWSVAVSGNTVIVGAPSERSAASGINSNQSDDNAAAAGAAYIFFRNNATWSQQAYLKASNTDAIDRFGYAVALSGNTAVVGAPFEDSADVGVGGNQTSNSGTDAGAAYVFIRTLVANPPFGLVTGWVQQAYLKASNTGADDQFGFAVAVAGDTVVVGAPNEDSAAREVDGNPGDLASKAGAAYVFARSGSTWSQQAYLKAANADADDQFGFAVAVAGNTVVVGAPQEDGQAAGVNGAADNNALSDAGAAYVFMHNGSTWYQESYLKASNPGLGDKFGKAVAVDGITAVVGADNEDSSATGVNGNQINNFTGGSGAAYVFILLPNVIFQDDFEN